jgi:hypothetical protein
MEAFAVFNKEILDSLLKEVKGMLVLELLDYASKIEDSFINRISSLESYGINNNALLICGHTYTYEDQEVVELGSFKEEDIYKDNKIIVKKNQVKQLKRVDEKLTLVKLIYACVVEYLARLNRYTRPLCIPVYMRDILINKEDGVYLEESRELNTLFDSIDLFIGEDTWSWYTPKLTNTTLIIKKGVDFRIYDWYRDRIPEDE